MYCQHGTPADEICEACTNIKRIAELEAELAAERSKRLRGC